ncbi:tyrosine-type recombinase/integrase [Sporolactobacillus putidus]|uniref:Tyrosine recombinase XerC n=1 Tax=Sporolactobacillus putidus TaxID=492735 RepID=A0A917S3T3_9BACL|nr:tyrosine-type recombinase/integrase [Sporolactobacillus putidus]GGL55610.1 tyrosine recombinase XerC [Sporolactobacillus putidus]
MKDSDFYIENFMLYCTSKNLSKKTLMSYEQAIKLFFIYMHNEFQIDEVAKVEKIHIQKYIQYLKQRGKYTAVSNPESEKINHPINRTDYKKELSITTISNYVRDLKVFFNYLFHEEEVLIKNPIKKIPNIKSERKVKRLISDDDFINVMKQFDVTTFHGYRNYTVCLLIFDTGIRIGEALNVMVRDLDFKHKSLLITNPKNKKQRYVFFSLEMLRNLKHWIKFWDRYSDSEWLFPTIRGTKLEERNFEYALRQAGKRANVDVHPHLLRNNYAKRYLLNGGDLASLSQLLGHSSTEVTKSAYLDFTNEEIGQIYQRYSPLSNLTKKLR